MNGLRRVLLSFGDKIETELQLQKQINPEQTDDIRKNMVQSSDKQIEEKSNVLVQEPVFKIEHEHLESDKNKGLLIINSCDRMFVKSTVHIFK